MRTESFELYIKSVASLVIGVRELKDSEDELIPKVYESAHHVF